MTINPVLGQLKVAMSAMQTMLLVFLSLGTLMVGWLFALNCSLVVRGMTMCETFKWLDYKEHCIQMVQESRYGAIGARASG